MAIDRDSYGGMDGGDRYGHDRLLDDKIDQLYTDEPLFERKPDLQLKQALKKKSQRYLASVTGWYSARSVGHKIAFICSTAVMAALVINIPTLRLIGGNSNEPTGSPAVSEEAKTTEVAGETTEKKPKIPFDVLLPVGKEVDERYDPQRQVVSYEDYQGENRFIVSQQLLSEADVANSSLLDKIAADYYADKRYQTNKGSMYVGRDVETGIQTGIIKYRSILMFMQCRGQVTEGEWVAFVNDLQ